MVASGKIGDGYSLLPQANFCFYRNNFQFFPFLHIFPRNIMGFVNNYSSIYWDVWIFFFVFWQFYGSVSEGMGKISSLEKSGL
jgi:hypothetical protein